mgnify:CR=1 FL=1
MKNFSVLEENSKELFLIRISRKVSSESIVAIKGELPYPFPEAIWSLLFREVKVILVKFALQDMK